MFLWYYLFALSSAELTCCTKLWHSGRSPTCRILVNNARNMHIEQINKKLSEKDPHYSPLTNHNSPPTTHHSPLTARRSNSPLATRHSPLATRHSPLATRHSPRATRHSPLATHHSPLTTHHSPLISHLHFSLDTSHFLPGIQSTDPSSATRYQVPCTLLCHCILTHALYGYSLISFS